MNVDVACLCHPLSFWMVTPKGCCNSIILWRYTQCIFFSTFLQPFYGVKEKWKKKVAECIKVS